MDHVVKGFTSLGVFADFRIPKPEDFELIKRCGFSEVIIAMAPRNWETDRWNPKFSKDSYHLAFERAYDADLTPHLMIWAHRTRRFLEAALPDVRDLVGTADYQAESLLLDCEGDWHRSRDNTSSVDAAVMVSNRLGSARWGVTGLSTLRSALKPLVLHASYVVPQPYSIWKPGSGRHWSHGRATFPGVQQVTSYNSWHREGGPEFIMGLANYWGARPKSSSHPAITNLQAIRWSMSETLALGITRAWFWSLKWMKGRNRVVLRRFFGSDE